MNNDVENLKLLVDRLVGNHCWGVSVGGCTGSRFILSLGMKIKRNRELTNPSLPELLRLYEAELGVHVGCAAWRLDGKTKVVTSSTDDCSPGGPMAQGLSQLMGKSVRAARVTSPGVDCVIEFEDGLCLSIFCDQFEPDLTNYTIFYGGFSVTVVSRSEVVTEGSLT
jgi:hypothetical protein